ncbi:gliding motility-associated C-terminal domain-containing protein [Flavobacterium sp. DSR3-2]|uniref:T9SS type B sorting domain-containing protein n=1 Tax=Flavobacterium sp. DSR3-2 TaxID=2804634 RepID=UPI003CEB7379
MIIIDRKSYLVLTFLFLILTFSCYAQTSFRSDKINTGDKGYIYVHVKTLDESSSLDFSFTGTSGIPSFALNDNPAQIDIKDLGSSQNGRLWAVSTSGVLFYRDLGSAIWGKVSVGTDVINAVDGGPMGTCFYTTDRGLVRSFDGTTVTPLSSFISNHDGSSALDIASTWSGEPYITTVSGKIFKYSGISSIWNQVGVSATNVRIDGNPLTHEIIVSRKDNTIYSIASTGTEKPLGTPQNSKLIYDVAVDGEGAIFVNCSLTGSTTEGFVHKWISGSLWSSSEQQSRNLRIVTGGIGGQLWSIPTLATSLQSNIFTRSSSGSNIFWIDDERVRLSPSNGNSYMLAVAPGTYALTEIIPSSWDLHSISIYDPTSNSTSSIGNRTGTLSVEAGETVHAVFQNGLVIPFEMTADCSVVYSENFGIGSPTTYGAALVGQTSYHAIEKSANVSEGYYSVVSEINSDWDNLGIANKLSDHTLNDVNGRMLAVNASHGQDEFFRKRFTGLILGATYSFSAWIAPITSMSPVNPNVKFNAVNSSNQIILKEFSTGNISAAGWKKYELKFVASENSIDLVLQNNNTGGVGNDLAIDDVTFELSPLALQLIVEDQNSVKKGSITVKSPLGDNYQYSIDGINFQKLPTFSNLEHGNYTIYSRFLNTSNCVTSKTVTINLLTADLVIEKIANYYTPYVGEEIVFTITVRNRGPYDASEVSVTDNIPSGYKFVRAVPSKGIWTTPKWEVEDLSDGENASLSIYVTVNPSGDYSNVASVTGIEIDPFEANNTDTAIIVPIHEIFAEADTNSIPINGINGGDSGIDVFFNDTLNRVLFLPSDVFLTSTRKGPLTVNTDGSVTVLPNTAAGTYTVDYTICEVLNPSNCATATVTITVMAAEIKALDDTSSTLINGSTGGDTGINVYSNDTLNGVALNPSDVVLTSTSKGPLTVNTDGSVTVLPNTAAGTYTVDYTICEVLNPSNCATATGTITVMAAEIKALEDMSSTLINGSTGGDTGINVYSNDTLNGVALNPSDVVLTSTRKGPLTVNTDGSVTVLPNTAAGTYTVDYTICEVLNPSNCDTATVTITVMAAEIKALEDTNSTLINGSIGGDTGINVYSNDTLNGVALNPSDVVLTSTSKGPLTVNTDGSVTVLPNTAAGTYTVDYTICEVLNPANCDTATVTITVMAAEIKALEDTSSTLINGSTGGDSGINVYSNDTLNGVALNPSDVVLTSTPEGPLTVNTDGSVTVLPNTAVGTYTVDYTICEVLNPANCDAATVTITIEIVSLPTVALIKTAIFNDSNNDGFTQVGETIQYNFTIINTGLVPLVDVFLVDAMPAITLTGNPISLSPGESDSISFTAIYTITSEDLKIGNITNQAIVYGTSPTGIIVQDLSDPEDVNGDEPTVVEMSMCSTVQVFNAITPNNDGENDFLFISGLDCYTDNSVEIYNRWGVLVYSSVGYNNGDIAFKGFSEGRLTINPNEALPIGVYYYFLKYNDKNGYGMSKTGYLYLNK